MSPLGVVGRSHYDRYCARCLLRRADDGRGSADGNVDFERNELGGQRRQMGDISSSKAPLDLEIVAFDVAKFAHAAHERTEPTGFKTIGTSWQGQETNQPHFALLRANSRGI